MIGSMLVIPMSDEKDEIVGVLQLINALDEAGKTIPFDEDYEEIVQALASLAAVSINNHKLAQEINDPEHYEFVHGVGIGKWGEYHNCIYSTGDETNRGAVIDWVSTLFTKEFTKIPTFINYHRLMGSMKSDRMLSRE